MIGRIWRVRKQDLALQRCLTARSSSLRRRSRLYRHDNRRLLLLSLSPLGAGLWRSVEEMRIVSDAADRTTDADPVR